MKNPLSPRTPLPRWSGRLRRPAMSQDLTRAEAVGGEHTSAGGRLVSVDGRTLPLRSVALRGDAAGGLARIVLEQRFQNPYPDPLRVTYQVPLPLEAAVSGYAFQIGGGPGGGGGGRPPAAPR